MFLIRPTLDYQQQVWYLAAENKMDSPQALFLMDLEKSTLAWQAEGDTVIVIVDLNDNVQLQSIQGSLQLWVW